MDGVTTYPGRWWHTLPDGRVQCDLCPRDCRLHEGQRGLCFVRKMEGGRMVLTTYGRSSGFCIDPVEKKPLNHFYPGSSILSFGTAGCNLACKFCQNWDISKSREMDRLQDEASPEAIAHAAVRLGCKSVAFTYNDPVIFAEYAMDAADACHARGIKAVAVTGKERSDELPDVPSMAEAGYPEVDVHLWSGIFAPSKVPPAIVAKLQKVFAAAIADTSVAAKLKAMAVNPGGATPDQFEKIIQSDVVKFGDVVKAANLKFEE